MKVFRRLFCALTTVVALLAGTFATASTASAASGECSSSDGGQICVQSYSNGYNVWFTNNSGTTKHLDFNLQCDNGNRYGDQGDFWSYPGNRNSYFFEVGYQGTCHTRMYDYGAGRWYGSNSGYGYYNF